MTLVVTLLAGPFVQQASDRLLTKGKNPVERRANKSLVVETANAIVAVGYAGLAQFGGLPTDHILAEYIVGCRIERPTPAVSLGPTFAGHSVEKIAQTIADGLEPRMPTYQSSLMR
jgi:hypothetical protein